MLFTLALLLKSQCILQLQWVCNEIFVFQRHAKGQVLLQQVFEHLELIEKDYFGLQFIDTGPESEGMVCTSYCVISLL